MSYELFLGDGIEELAKIKDNSIDMIFADLPYGTTYAKWDSILPLDKLWREYNRIIKDNCAIVLTASQPFTSKLILSNLDQFRCEWIWNKENAANFANAKHQPLKQHENVLIFSRGKTRYYPQKVQGNPNHIQGKNAKKNVSELRLINERVEDDISGMKYPKTIVTFSKHSSQSGLHPTQKPVDLMRYFIKTYSLENEIVLDNTMGSGSTGVAALLENRKFIGIELEEKYFYIAKERIEKEIL